MKENDEIKESESTQSGRIQLIIVLVGLILVLLVYLIKG